MPAGFKIPPDLPEGVADLFLLTKYHVDYAAPKFFHGARLRGTGGYKIFSADGAPASGIIPAHATLDEWRAALGVVLDTDIRIKNGGLAGLFRDPLGSKP